MNLLILAQDTPVSDPWMIWALAPVGALVALAMAYAFSRNVMAQREGDADMIEIAEHVRAGAMAYLVRQYKVVFVVFLVLVFAYYLISAIPPATSNMRFSSSAAVRAIESPTCTGTDLTSSKDSFNPKPVCTRTALTTSTRFSP